MTVPDLPPSLRAWHDAGFRFSHQGHPVFARRDGPADAPVLLLIHGFPTASWDWAEIWPVLASRYRVLAPDLIGFGFSAKPPAHPYSIADQADLCEALLRHERVTDYHVLAHDYGDTVAQELLARQLPDRAGPRLRSVALLNGGLFPEAHRPLAAQKVLASPLGPLQARLMSRGRFGASMTRIFGAGTPPSQELLDGFWRLLLAHDGRRVLPRLIGYMEERREQRGRWVGALVHGDVPLKLINGAADPISGEHMAARYRELVPNADVTLLAGIGHYPQCEAPAAVLEAYLEFRAVIDAGAGGIGAVASC
jgi:pimeloyl-ACP methyl ester carboxylesterase